jgi:hypothetical protein
LLFVAEFPVSEQSVIFEDPATETGAVAGHGVGYELVVDDGQ